LGEDWSYGRQPRQKIRQDAMPQGRSRPSSSKRPDTYPTPAWQVAGDTNLLMSFPLNCGQRFSATAAWGTAGFMYGETAMLRRGQATDDDKRNLDGPIRMEQLSTIHIG